MITRTEFSILMKTVCIISSHFLYAHIFLYDQGDWKKYITDFLKICTKSEKYNNGVYFHCLYFNCLFLLDNSKLS